MLNRSLLFVLAMVVYLVGATEFMLSAIMSPLAVIFNVQVQQISWLISAYALSYVLAAPIIGYLSDKRDKRKMILIALLCLSFDSLAIIFAPNLLVALILRIFGGLASAALVPLTFALVSDIFAEKKQIAAMGFVMLGMTLGIITGPIIAGGLVQFFAWYTPFIFTAIGGGIIFIVALKILPSSKAPTVRQISLSIFKQSNITKLIIAKGIWNGITVCLFLLAGEILRDREQLDSAVIGILMGLFGIGLILGNSIVAKVTAFKISEMALLQVIIIALLIALILFISGWLSLIGHCLCLFAFGIALGLTSPISTTLLARQAVDNKGLVLSVSESFNNLVLLVALPIFSVLIAGEQLLFVGMLIFVLFCLALVCTKLT